MPVTYTEGDVVEEQKGNLGSLTAAKAGKVSNRAAGRVPFWVGERESS